MKKLLTLFLIFLSSSVWAGNNYDVILAESIKTELKNTLQELRFLGWSSIGPIDFSALDKNIDSCHIIPKTPLQHPFDQTLRKTAFFASQTQKEAGFFCDIYINKYLWFSLPQKERALIIIHELIGSWGSPIDMNYAVTAFLHLMLKLKIFKNDLLPPFDPSGLYQAKTYILKLYTDTLLSLSSCKTMALLSGGSTIVGGGGDFYELQKKSEELLELTELFNYLLMNKYLVKTPDLDPLIQEYYIKNLFLSFIQSEEFYQVYKGHIEADLKQNTEITLKHQQFSYIENLLDSGIPLCK